jgi:hypothetical protein
VALHDLHDKMQNQGYQLNNPAKAFSLRNITFKYCAMGTLMYEMASAITRTLDFISCYRGSCGRMYDRPEICGA